jgi:hypothetical protein
LAACYFSCTRHNRGLSELNVLWFVWNFILWLAKQKTK